MQTGLLLFHRTRVGCEHRLEKDSKVGSVAPKIESQFFFEVCSKVVLGILGIGESQKHLELLLELRLAFLLTSFCVQREASETLREQTRPV